MLETTTTNNPYEQRGRALHLYRQQEWKGKIRRLFAWLQHRPAQLAKLNQDAAPDAGHEQHYAGLQAVAIDAIAGTEEQAPGFDRGFFPLRADREQNWLSIAEARLAGRLLPPVQLIQVGEAYYVRDGHHRISVAKALDEAFVDAEIVRWQIR
jgi:hypothetical protein